MRSTSIRFRITAMVAGVFALVLVGSSLGFLRWYEGRLVGEVEADDNDELDRQLDFLEGLDRSVQLTMGVIDVDELLEADDGEILLAIVPDDGTIVSIFNADGELIGDSAISFQALADGLGTDVTTGTPLGDLTETEMNAAMLSLPAFSTMLDSELLPETKVEYAVALEFIAGLGAQMIGEAPTPPSSEVERVATAQLPGLYRAVLEQLSAERQLDFAFAIELLGSQAADTDPTIVVVEAPPEAGDGVEFEDLPQPSDEEVAAQAEVDRLFTELLFGADDQAAAVDGRLITSSRQSTFLEQPILITAESRVTGIDTALNGLTRTLWAALPALVALVAALTYVATGRALQPVEAITDQVVRISSAQTGGRVPVPATGDEIHRLATTMNGMLDRLESGAAGQRRFVSDVSHELRTPSAVIRAEIEAGLADPDNDWPKTAESVLNEQTRLSELVDDLLLLARIDEQIVKQHTEIDLDALVQTEASRGWVHPVSIRKVEPVRIRGDNRQLTRVVQNLLANANRHAISTIELALRAEEGFALLIIEDDGLGVPSADRDRIFDRFSRLEAGRERDTGGSGLGLAIVKEVANAHGGDALVTNSSLGGARFEVRLAL